MARKAIQSPGHKAALLWLAVACAAGVALAQMQVNNRANPQLYPSGPARTMAQNYRPNDYNVGSSVHYRTPRQVGLLPSEVLMARQRSGALPSELRMNAEQAGPLNPYGAIAYIPNQSTVQQLMRLPAPQLYNPAYHLSPALNQVPVTSPMGGSIGYSAQPRSPVNTQSSMWTQTPVRPQPTRTRSTGSGEGGGGAIPANAPTPSLSDKPAAPEPHTQTLGYGSIHFSSINPPQTAR